jgi:hypothetical protein
MYKLIHVPSGASNVSSLNSTVSTAPTSANAFSLASKRLAAAVSIPLAVLGNANDVPFPPPLLPRLPWKVVFEVVFEVEVEVEVEVGVNVSFPVIARARQMRWHNLE